MGDRTDVTLTVHRSNFEKLCSTAWFDQPDHTVDMDHPLFNVRTHNLQPSGSDRVHLQYEEVNHGDLDFLGQLQESGIPYDSCWNYGDNYSSGTEYLRFDANGNALITVVYEEDENPPLTDLMDRLNNPKALVAFIREYHDKVTPLPWDHQLENAKVFLTRQLLKS